MTRPLLVGITGGIGSGKSTISKVFEILKIPVYYADDRGKFLLTNDSSLKDQVVQSFGKESYNDDGSINRQFLANEVFPDQVKLDRLNSLVHPAVSQDFESWVRDNSTQKYLLKEAALLFETGSYKSLDRTICVLASKEIRMGRVLLRDEHRSGNDIDHIMSKQISDGQRKKLADYLLLNNGFELIIPQVLKIHEKLLERTLD